MALRYDSYVPLEGGSSEIIKTPDGKGISFSTTENVSFATSTSLIYSILIIACVTATAFVYVKGGLLRMQATEAGIRKSNEEFKRGTLGLLGVLSLFLILFTINRDMVRGNIDLGEFKMGKSSVTTADKTTPTTQTGGGISAYKGASYTEITNSHNKVVGRLAPSGINTNHNNAPCTESQLTMERNPSCTSLAFLPEESIQIILNLNSACRCTLVISGGTEPGHAINGYHGMGKRGFDLKLSESTGSPNNPDPLYVFIKKTSRTNLGANGSCYSQYVYNGFTFCDEKKRSNSTWAPHFHVY